MPIAISMISAGFWDGAGATGWVSAFRRDVETGWKVIWGCPCHVQSKWGSLLENKPARGTVSPQTEKGPSLIVQLICVHMLLILGIAGVNQVSFPHAVWLRALFLAPRNFINPGLPFSLQWALSFSLSCLFPHPVPRRTCHVLTAGMSFHCALASRD